MVLVVFCYGGCVTVAGRLSLESKRLRLLLRWLFLRWLFLRWSDCLSGYKSSQALRISCEVGVTSGEVPDLCGSLGEVWC